jgi:NAD(P)-dependent dehydrogenase (short-subunit alcohol dehydrogenase family)
MMETMASQPHPSGRCLTRGWLIRYVALFSDLKGIDMKDTPVVIITGASRGVGAAVARWLGKAGAHVTLIARSAKPLKGVAKDVERLGGMALPIIGDVADPEACRNAVQQSLDRFDRLDALVNNAGIFQPMSSIAMAAPEAWRYTIEVNLLGPFYLTHASIFELSKPNGRIVNVSSGAANIPVQAGSAYCASKAALVQFTRVLAEEEPSLTAVAVRPGVVDTEMQALIRREGHKAMSSEQMAYYRSLKKEGKLEPPLVPARSIAWLSLHAPHHWSGDFLDYDDPRILEPALSSFGNRLEEIGTAG